MAIMLSVERRCCRQWNDSSSHCGKAMVQTVEWIVWGFRIKKKILNIKSQLKMYNYSAKTRPPH